MILGLAASLPSALLHGLTAQGVNVATATRISHLPPVGSLFAAFLGYNPMQTLLGHQVLSHLSPHHAAVLTGRSFFPRLLSSPFESGLQKAFTFALVASLVAAVSSWLRGGKYHHGDAGVAVGEPHAAVGPVTRDDAGPSEVATPSPAGAEARSAAAEG
jgi:hypothetical protein